MTSRSFDCTVYAAILGKEEPTLPLQGEWLYLGFEVVPVQSSGEKLASVRFLEQGASPNSDDHCTSLGGIKSRSLNIDIDASNEIQGRKRKSLNEDEVHCVICAEEVRVNSPPSILVPLDKPQQGSQNNHPPNSKRKEETMKKKKIVSTATTRNSNRVGKMNDTNKYQVFSDGKIIQQDFAGTKTVRQKAKTKDSNARIDHSRGALSILQTKYNVNKQALTLRYNPELNMETSSYDSIFSFCEFGVLFVVIRYLFLQEY